MFSTNRTIRILLLFSVCAILVLLIPHGGRSEVGRGSSESQSSVKSRNSVAFERPISKNIRPSKVRVEPITASTLSRDSAIEVALAEPDRNKRNQLLGAIVEVWVASDPEACFLWCNALLLPADRSYALISTVKAVLNGGSGDLQKSLTMIDRIKAGEIKDDVIIYNFESIIQMDTMVALETISLLAGRGAIAAAANMLATSMAQTANDQEIAELWGRIPYGSFRDDFAISYVMRLSEQNLNDAFEWLQKNGDFDAANDAYIVAANGYAAKSPEAGLERAAQIADEATRKKFAAQIGLEWAKANPKAAGEWLVAMLNKNTGSTSNPAFGPIINRWMQWDHVAPFEAIQQISNPVDRKNMLADAIGTLSIYSPREASAKAISEIGTTSPEGIRTIKRVVDNWMGRDSIEASAWIGAMESGPAKDASIQIIVSKLIGNNGDASMATAWAMQISSGNLRKTTLEQISKIKK